MTTSGETEPLVLPQSRSYVLVTNSSHRASRSDLVLLSARSPRAWWLLPLVSLLDLGTAIALSVLVLRSFPVDNDSVPYYRDPRLVWACLTTAAARTLTLSVVGFSPKIRSQAPLVAAICLLSLLVLASIENLLFQARAVAESLPTPTLSLLAGHQLILTMIEWVTYVAVVGVRVPPGGVGRASANKWQDGVRSEWRRGSTALEQQSVYAESEAGERVEEAAIDAVEEDVPQLNEPRDGQTTPDLERGQPSEEIQPEAEDQVADAAPEEDETSDADPDDIIDMPLDRRVSRHEAAMRLAQAKERGDWERRERRISAAGRSTLSIASLLGRSPTGADLGTSTPQPSTPQKPLPSAPSSSISKPAPQPLTPANAPSLASSSSSVASSSRSGGLFKGRLSGAAQRIKKPNWMSGAGGKKKAGKGTPERP